MNGRRAPAGPLFTAKLTRLGPALADVWPTLGTHVLTWAFVVRAGDGNRTRTISLGMSAAMSLTSTSAGRQRYWLVREYP